MKALGIEQRADRRIRVEPDRADAGRIRLGLARSRDRYAGRGGPEGRDVHADRDAAEVADRPSSGHSAGRRRWPRRVRSARGVITTFRRRRISRRRRKSARRSPSATASIPPSRTGRPITSSAATTRWSAIRRRPSARFREWLQARYKRIDALNAAWGTVFWSMEYRSFDEIDAPVATVTEAHPSHRLDYRRFASDEVARYNRMQVEIIRAHSPGRPVAHNFMQLFTEFDHYKVAADLDVATWDSYPLGALEEQWFAPRSEGAVAAQRASRLRVVQSRRLSRHVEAAVLGDGAAAGSGELGAVESGAAAGHGAAVELGSVRARRGMRVVFPLASGAVRAGADACGFEHAG